MKCFYHSADLDGHCSGAIVRLYYGSGCEMWPIDYGHKFPWDRIRSDETVVMVDFHLQPFDDMLRLKNACERLVWIDHHISAIKEAEQFNFACDGIRKDGIGAAFLVWDYYYPGKEVPAPVLRVAEYDVWDHSHEFTLPFQYGARLYETDPATKKGLAFWEDLIFPPSPDLAETSYGRIVREGTVCLTYQEQLNAKLCKFVFEVEFEGYKCIAVNAPLVNSLTFNPVWNPQKYDIMLAFYMRGFNRWVVSLYTDKEIDVSQIAKKYGGGGHKKAAGFQCTFPPFLYSSQVRGPIPLISTSSKKPSPFKDVLLFLMPEEEFTIGYIDDCGKWWEYCSYYDQKTQILGSEVAAWYPLREEDL